MPYACPQSQDFGQAAQGYRYPPIATSRRTLENRDRGACARRRTQRESPPPVHPRSSPVNQPNILLEDAQVPANCFRQLANLFGGHFEFQGAVFELLDGITR